MVCVQPCMVSYIMVGVNTALSLFKQDNLDYDRIGLHSMLLSVLQDKTQVGVEDVS